MHTFLSHDDGTFGIGTWQLSQSGWDSFVELFRVETIRDAVRAVNALNGGAATFTIGRGTSKQTISIPGQ